MTSKDLLNKLSVYNNSSAFFPYSLFYFKVGKFAHVIQNSILSFLPEKKNIGNRIYAT